MIQQDQSLLPCTDSDSRVILITGPDMTPEPWAVYRMLGPCTAGHGWCHETVHGPIPSLGLQIACKCIGSMMLLTSVCVSISLPLSEVD